MKALKLILSLSMGAFLIACGFDQKPVWSATRVPRPSSTNTNLLQITLRITPQPTSTSTDLPVWTVTNVPTEVSRKSDPPKITLRITPRATRTPTGLPSWTATPWVDIDHEKFFALYETHGDCKLPCWWGITPGKTTLAEARELFAPYGYLFYFDDYINENKSGISYISVSFLAPTPMDDPPSGRFGFDPEGVIQKIEIRDKAVKFNGFTPTYLLSEFGEPDQIYLQPIRLDQVPNQMFVFYESQSLLAEYGLLIQEDSHQACFLDCIDLHSWGDGVNLTLENVKQKYNLYGRPTWQEITDDSFAQVFATWRGSDNCFTISADAWP